MKRRLSQLCRTASKALIGKWSEAASCGSCIDLEEYTETVTAYISKFIDDVTATKAVTSRANQRPWLTAEVRMLLRMQDVAPGPLKQREITCHMVSENQHRTEQIINSHLTDERHTHTSVVQGYQGLRRLQSPTTIQHLLTGITQR